MRPVLLALALMAALPLTAQEDEQPFFSVASSRTWASHDKPEVQVSAWQVPSLEFRLYRIKDPVAFFSGLKDLHQFGGREPRAPRPLTPLERFHAWKNDWRYEYRSLIREQFDSDAHARISNMLDPQRESQAARRITHFTPLPLLNSQQVVAVWKQIMPKRGGWSYEAVHFDNPGSGVYLLEAADKDLRAYTVVIVSDIAMITKQAPGRLLTYVADRQSGAPVADASVFVVAHAQTAAQLTSDANGMASTPLILANVQNLVVMAHRGGDWTVESPYGFGFERMGANRWLGYIYADRPIYRPGHAVNFKAILRRENGLEYSVPNGQIDFQVQDPEGKTVFEKKAAALSAMGTAWGQFTLKSDAALGYYSVIARTPNVQQMSGGFNVEEYKKPEYEVRVAIAKPRTFEGDPIQATIDARYFFGEPVANAKVTWVAHRSPYYSPVFWRDDEDEDGEGGPRYEPDQGGAEMEEQTGKLDADGKLNISVPTSLGQTDFDYRIEARVTDEGNREITGFSHAIATRGSFVINVEPDRYVYSPGQTANFKVQARDYDGKPVATKIHLDLMQWNWRDVKDRKTLASSDGSTDAAAGVGTITMQVPRAGSVMARITARTPEGREVDDETYLWITSGIASGSGFGEFSNGQDIQILPDQKTYKPGDTAKLLIVSQSQMDHVLVTVEGRGIDAPQVLHPGAKSFTIEMRVKPEYAPNFNVAVSAFIKGEAHQGGKSIRVPAAEKQLAIDIRPGKDQYKPGDAAVYNVSARDASGKPVAAELSLGVVDEAIYAIQPDQTPGMMDFFYGRRYNEVQTETSLSYFFSGAAGTRRMQLTKLRAATALAQLKPERLVQPKVRKAFPDTAFWVANLTTNSSGQATARFDFPDSLTTWRATARAVTADTRVGSATEKTITRKNLMLRIAAPRFLTQGDEVVISAIVHNYLTDAKTARVSLDLQGLDVLRGATQDVKIPSRGDARVDWRVRPKDVANVTITGKALTDEESDAMEMKLPVNPIGIKETISRTGVLTENSTAFDLPYPAAGARLGRKLTISVTPSMAGALFGALDYLTSFPYGCTEQIMSSFLPNLVVSGALRDLHIKTSLDETDLNAKVRAGLDRLYESQHQEGGWGWWPTDDSSIFMTAYVVAGLNQANDLGHRIRPSVVPRAVKWLRDAVAKDPKIDPDLRAYAAYAIRDLAGDYKDLDSVWNARSALSPYGLALLGLALDLKQDNRAAQVEDELESKVTQDAESAHWQLDRDSLMGFYGDTTPEATAFALKLLVHRKPESPLIPKAARWLVANRSDGFSWYSTKQTAMVIYGLTDYLKQSGELNADFTADISVNGRGVLKKHFTATDALAAVPEEITVPDTDGVTPSVQVTRTGSGRLYWTAREDYYSTDRKLVDKGAVKLNIIREYFRLIPGQKNGRIVYDPQALNGPLKTGDLLGVRLTVSGSEWRYVIAEDPIPAGAEFIARDDLYELRDPGNWWRNYYTRREFHDDRAAFFNTYFAPGQKQYFYLLKITNAGAFKVNPARVYPMYQTDRTATTAPFEVTVH